MSRRILVISTAMRIGGVERALIGLLDSLIREGHEVSLFLWAHEGEFMGLLPPGVHLLPEMPAYARLERPIRQAMAQGFPGIGLARLAAKAVTAFRAKVLHRPGYLLPRSVRYCLPFLPRVPGQHDLVLSFLAPHDIAARKTSASCRAGWIHTDYGSLESGVDTTFEASMWQNMDALMAVSEGVRDSFIRVFPALEDRVQVMENILSPAFIRQQADEDVSEEMPFEPGVARICSVGRFCYQKNFGMVPEIVRLLDDMGCPVRWYLIGYGPDEALIRRRIQEAGVQDRVLILGKKANPYPYMKACDCYVQPSRYEGKAVTVREAQILGKPVLIADFPTAGSQLENGVDGLVTPMDIEGIAAAIQKLIKDPELCGRLAATAASRDYSNRAEVEKINQLLAPPSMRPAGGSLNCDRQGLNPFLEPGSRSQQEVASQPAPRAPSASTELVSIIVPCYNAGQYIRDCLTSVLRQTHPFLEVLVIDDGSTDDSRSLVEEFEQSDPRVHLLLQKAQSNQGPSAARNLGLTNASGKFVLFVDADDCILPNMVEDLLAACIRMGADLVACGYQEIRSHGITKYNDFMELSDNPSRAEFIRRILQGTGGVIWAKIFRKTIIDSETIRFDPEFRMCEDLLFNIKFVMKANKYGVLNQYLYQYNRGDENSITAQLDDDEFSRQLKLQKQINHTLELSTLPSELCHRLACNRIMVHLNEQVLRNVTGSAQRPLRETIGALKHTIVTATQSPYWRDLSAQDFRDQILLGIVTTRSAILLYIYCLSRLLYRTIKQKLFNKRVKKHEKNYFCH